jgi:hypothetical protein
VSGGVDEAREMRAPDYTNCVAAVRIWRVAPTLWAQLGGLLWAPAMREPWATGEEYYASCQSNPDHVPGEGCGCGLYAFYSPAMARAGGYWVPGRGQSLYNRVLAGVIGAAGDMELCEHGMRTERATVEAIFDDGAPDPELPMPRGELAAAYGAEVIGVGEYEDFCGRRGMVVIDPTTL